MIEDTLLEGKYSLRDKSGKPVPPEHFLGLFRNTAFYQDVQRFVRRVDNDTGIPFLSLEEYEKAKLVLPVSFLNAYEEEGFISFSQEKVYLRGKRYYLNYLIQNNELMAGFSETAIELLEKRLIEDIELYDIIAYASEKSHTLEERMLVGSLLDLYKNHLMTTFTGLYEAMKLDETIDVSHYTLIRRGVERIIDDYYKFMLKRRVPSSFLSKEHLIPVLDVIRTVVDNTHKVYDGRRYLGREFDHPGRMILYGSHLLSQIKQNRRKYDLLVNLLNGSAEIGLAVQSIDNLLGTNNIRSTTIFEVDFARYSRKDREDKDISTYSEFETIAIPAQLKQLFKQRIQDKDTLIVDDNLNTGQSLYNVRRALEEIAKSVDVSVVEVTPRKRVIELIKKKFKQKGIKGADSHIMIKLVEDELTYTPIGWWRDHPKMLEQKRIERIIGLNI